MFKNRRARIRHAQLMTLANDAIRAAILNNQRTSNGLPDVTPTDLVALMFGAHGIHITEDVATDYLDAVLAQRGYRSSSANQTA